MTCTLPWLVFWRDQILGVLYAVDADTALDQASVRFAESRFDLGDDSELRVMHPAEAH